MASRTKDKLIDVARQLFAHKGVENTTMNDIASASDKGRRTIYTYFKSKTEIFNAVVNREAQSIIERIADIPSMPISPEEKLMNFIFSRFEAVKEVVGRNGSLKASFFLDVRRVDRIRRVNKHKEIVLLKEILNEGVQQGAFRIKHVDKTAEILLMAMQGHRQERYATLKCIVKIPESPEERYEMSILWKRRQPCDRLEAGGGEQFHPETKNL